MTTSEQPFQPITLPLTLTDCVYFLPSAEKEAGRFKIGVTAKLAARVASLRQSDGPLDLDRGVVIAAKDRRAAFDLEGVLRASFDAPKWRVETEGPAYNGSSEWYRIAALEPMVALVGDMIARDASCGVRRFALEPRTPWLEEWCRQARSVRQVRRWTEEELRAENGRLLARAEANFARLQAWMAARRDVLVEVRPAAEGDGRTFVFAGDERAMMAAMEDDELVEMCLVSWRLVTGRVTFGYFGCAGPDVVRRGAYSVKFEVTEAFREARGFSVELDALLTRIQDWIGRDSF